MISRLSILFFMIGCGSKEESPLSIQTDYENTPSSSTSNDTGNIEDTGDQTNEEPESSISEDSPVIESMSSFFNVDSEGVEVIETHVTFTDPQNDVENGQMFFDYESEASSGSLGMEIGGAYVIYEYGGGNYELTHYLYDINVNFVYEISVQLQDIAGNVSETNTTTVNPVVETDDEENEGAENEGEESESEENEGE